MLDFSTHLVATANANKDDLREEEEEDLDSSTVSESEDTAILQVQGLKVELSIVKARLAEATAKNELSMVKDRLAEATAKIKKLAASNRSLEKKLTYTESQRDQAEAHLKEILESQKMTRLVRVRHDRDEAIVKEQKRKDAARARYIRSRERGELLYTPPLVYAIRKRGD